MRISDGSSDVCSSDLLAPSRDRIHRRRRKIGIGPLPFPVGLARRNEQRARAIAVRPFDMSDLDRHQLGPARPGVIGHAQQGGVPQAQLVPTACLQEMDKANARRRAVEIRDVTLEAQRARLRSEEHTSELQSLMRNTYAVLW